MPKGTKSRRRAVVEPTAITEIRVAGFKSISEEQSIEIRPLTILAGANSSGKSSIMQPLLLMKQTLEASFDPGPLLLHGPNIKLTSADQVLSRIGKGQSLDSFQVGMRLNSGERFQTRFRKEHKSAFVIEEMELAETDRTFTLWPSMSPAEIVKTGITQGMDPASELPDQYRQGNWGITRVRCFLQLEWVVQESFSETPSATMQSKTSLGTRRKLAAVWEQSIPEVIHLPGLRGNPERAYPVTAVGNSYPGTFGTYTASVVSQWIEENQDTLTALSNDLRLLRLAGGITARRVNGVQVELQVGRLPDVAPSRPDDRINIADVGVGVSQTLPVLVALHAAKPGQLVYIEQPEIHLHPKAQFALAQVLASAAKRGIRVVVETHSSILLLAVQALVAEANLEPSDVKLHWFERDKTGRSIVSSGDLDEAGRSVGWPEDFDEVLLQVQKQYLDAAERRLFAQ
jgi:predicted ATPase